MTEQQIFIALLDEGVAVWRPTPALRLEDQTYVILKPDDYDPADEHWQFAPGSVVVCEPRKIENGIATTAVRLADRSRKTA